MNDKYNGEGYYDPTPYKAIQHSERDRKNPEEDRVGKLIKAIFLICHVAGFSVQGRIVLRDNETGKVWR